jgi:hypothetical protein
MVQRVPLLPVFKVQGRQTEQHHLAACQHVFSNHAGYAYAKLSDQTSPFKTLRMAKKKNVVRQKEAAAAAAAAAAEAPDDLQEVPPGVDELEDAADLAGVEAVEGEEGFSGNEDDVLGDGPCGKLFAKKMKELNLTLREAMARYRVADSTRATYAKEFLCLMRFFVNKSRKKIVIDEKADPEKWIPAIKGFLVSEVGHDGRRMVDLPYSAIFSSLPYRVTTTLL